MDEKVKILYVDDEHYNLELFKLNFKKKYDILLANNASEGLEVLEHNPEVLIVISDMKMPNMNGLEFITLAKEMYPSIKFYILTGFEITEEISEALNSGLILKYFSKPFNINEIDSEIQKVINNADSD